MVRLIVLNLFFSSLSYFVTLALYVATLTRVLLRPVKLTRCVDEFVCLV